MTENEDLGQLAGNEPELDTDLFDEEGWNEDFESEKPQASPASRAASRKNAPAGAAAPGTSSPPSRRPLRRSAGIDGRMVLVAGVGLLVALPVTMGVLAGLRTSPAVLVGLQVGDVPATGPSLPFLLGAVASLALAVGAGFAFALWTRRTAQRHAADQALLAAVSSLDLEDPRGWQSPVLVADPNLAALTERLLGTYRLQQAKLTRYVCLEGELHRLGKALACAAREDLEGQWDNVAVGTAADEALRIIDNFAAVEAELATARKQISDNGPDLVAQLAEARGWTTTAVEQVNAQGAAIERLVVKLSRLAEAPATDETRSKSRQEQVIAAIRQDLAEIPARGARPNSEAAGANLTRLVDRASKLAFQIAMEVARLAGKNERLLPMTQDLEELTTELRAIVAGTGENESPDRTSRVLENIRGRVAELAAAIAERAEDPSRNVQAVSGELTPAARQVATALQQVSRGIGGQVQRLDQVLQLAATLTGIDVPPTATAEPVVEPGNSLLVDRFDPFHTGRPGEAPGIVADPFANSRSVFNPESSDSDFCQSVLPGLDDDPVAASVAPAPPIAALPTTTSVFELNAPAQPSSLDMPDLGDVFAAAPAPEPLPEPTPIPAPIVAPTPAAIAAPAAVAAAPEPQEERIYELSEFDGVEVAVEDDADRIHDLTEFDAERVA
jgi:hypothetical protein